MESTLRHDVQEASNYTTDFEFNDARDRGVDLDYLELKKEYPNYNIAASIAASIKKFTGDIPRKWDYFVDTGLISTFLIDAKQEIINEIEQRKVLQSETIQVAPTIQDDTFKRPGVLPFNEVASHCIIKELNIDKDLEEAYAHGKKALVYDAYTGSGKSLSLDMWIATRSLEFDSGILLTHTNAEAKRHYDNIVAWNPQYEGHIFIFNSDNQSEYKKVLRNPEILNQYNWVICYQSRLLSSDVDVLFTCLKNLDDRKRLRRDTHTYILSDECIPSADEQVLKKSDIAKIDQVSNYAFTAFFQDPNSESARRKLLLYFRMLEDRVMNLSSAKDLTLDDAVVLSAFNSKRDVRDSSIYQLKVYMARLNTLLNYMFDRTDDFMKKYSKLDTEGDVYIKYYPKISEIGLGHSLIIFDATAKINYGAFLEDNDYFYIKTIAELPKNVIDFHITDISFPARKKITKEQFDKFFDDLYNKKFRFEDNSIIIWNMNPYFIDAGTNPDVAEIYKHEETRKYSVYKLKEYLRRTGSRDCLVTYFNGGEIKGENRFSKCTNVYILSNYEFNAEAVMQAKMAMNNMSFSEDYKFLGDVIQCIGRGAIRNEAHKILPDGKGAMNIYLSRDVNPKHIAALIEYYGIQPNRIHYDTKGEFNKWVEVMLANAKASVGPTIKFDPNRDSGFFDTRGRNTVTEPAIRYLAELSYKGTTSIHVRELGESLGIKEPKLNKFEIAIRALNYLGLKMRVYSKYDELVTDAYKDVESSNAE